MNTNERIARGLGWTSHEFLVVGETITGWTRPDGLGESVPDYEQSDSHRYRQMGNAVCVPVAEWIGHRLMAV